MFYENLVLSMSALFFAVFLAGWLAHWFWSRASRNTEEREDRADELVAELLIVEDQRDQAITERQEIEAMLRHEAVEKEAELQTLLQQREAELEAAMDGLRDARREIETLKGA
ncbi:MAG: hypothetical protein AAF367_20095 [Pseudomonadota bacterium]